MKQKSSIILGIGVALACAAIVFGAVLFYRHKNKLKLEPEPEAGVARAKAKEIQQKLAELDQTYREWSQEKAQKLQEIVLSPEFVHPSLQKYIDKFKNFEITENNHKKLKFQYLSIRNSLNLMEINDE